MDASLVWTALGVIVLIFGSVGGGTRWVLESRKTAKREAEEALRKEIAVAVEAALLAERLRTTEAANSELTEEVRALRAELKGKR